MNRFPIIAAALLVLAACHDLGVDGFGAEGESCNADQDCRGEMLCLEGACGFRSAQWVLDTPPEELRYPQGLYRGTAVTFTNSNAATRALQPLTRVAFRDSGIRPSFILELDDQGDFVLHTGPVGGQPPELLQFFPAPLEMQALSGAAIDLGAEPVEFSLPATPSGTAPSTHFFLLLRGDGFDVPVPIAPARVRGLVAEDGDGHDMTVFVEGYILLAHARQVPVESAGPTTLPEFLGGDGTADVDFDRDGTPEGWSVQFEVPAERADF